MTAKGAPTGPAGQQTTAKAEPKRINVAVSPDTVRALENVIEREGVTLTEALRRLIGYGDFVYRAVRENREQLIVKGDEGSREVVLL
ncbi:ribbon-helix-helix domain-containing protein [Actinophytocola sp. KF-1]